MKQRILQIGGGEPNHPRMLWDTANGHYVRCHNNVAEMCDSACGVFLTNQEIATCSAVSGFPAFPLGDMAPEPVIASIPEAPAFPQKLHVDGNKIKNEQGEVVRFEGFAMPDPFGHTLTLEGLFAKMAEWNPTILRIPISPSRWRNFRDIGSLDRFWEVIDECIDLCKRYRIHAILDWHAVGFAPTDEYRGDWDKATAEETIAFWREASQRYAGNNVIAFYELYNEPTYSGVGVARSNDWLRHAAFMEKVIWAIRENDPETIVLVAGLNWAKDVEGALIRSIQDDNVAYAVHPYPYADLPVIKDVMERYPVFVSEFGHCWAELLIHLTDSKRKILGSYIPELHDLFIQAHREGITEGELASLWQQGSELIDGSEDAIAFMGGEAEFYERNIFKMIDEYGLSWTAWRFGRDDGNKANTTFFDENGDLLPWGRTVKERLAAQND